MEPGLMAIMRELKGIRESQSTFAADLGSLGSRVTQVESNDQVRSELPRARSEKRAFSANHAFDHRRSTFQVISDYQLSRSSVPKPLTDGSIIKATFNNGTSESVEEFLRDFERELRRTTFSPEFYVQLAMKQLGSSVVGTVEDEGARRMAGRFEIENEDGDFVDCPAGWCLWDEFKEYLLKRYHHPHYEILATEKLIFGLKQTAGFDKYVELFNRKCAAIAGCEISDQVKRICLLHHMRTDTREECMKDAA